MGEEMEGRRFRGMVLWCRRRKQNWRGWQTSPARINEDCSVELPRVGKPLGSSGASKSTEVGSVGYSVIVGNEAGQAQNGEISVDAWSY
jgi:hypothetical protein